MFASVDPRRTSVDTRETSVDPRETSVDPRKTSGEALLHGVSIRQGACHRESLWFKGEWVDDSLLAMLQAEWREN
ncbi:MAG: hypothetical protein ACJAYU_001863 [Bradymonadia bacterium]|jgi:hypothetical protein